MTCQIQALSSPLHLVWAFPTLKLFKLKLSTISISKLGGPSKFRTRCGSILQTIQSFKQSNSQTLETFKLSNFQSLAYSNSQTLKTSNRQTLNLNGQSRTDPDANLSNPKLSKLHSLELSNPNFRSLSSFESTHRLLCSSS